MRDYSLEDSTLLSTEYPVEDGEVAGGSIREDGYEVDLSQHGSTVRVEVRRHAKVADGPYPFNYPSEEAETVFLLLPPEERMLAGQLHPAALYASWRPTLPPYERIADWLGVEVRLLLAVLRVGVSSTLRRTRPQPRTSPWLRFLRVPKARQVAFSHLLQDVFADADSWTTAKIVYAFMHLLERGRRSIRDPRPYRTRSGRAVKQ